MGAGAGGMLEGKSAGGGEEAGGDASSFGGGEVASVRGLLSSGVVGPEGAGAAADSSEGGGEVGRGGTGSSFGGGEVGRGGGTGSSGGGGDVGKGGAEDSGGEAGSGGAVSSGSGGRAAGSSLKQTHVSLVSSPAGGTSSGPKMLSKSAIEGFLVLSASVDPSETQTTSDRSNTVFADVPSMFTHRDKT